MYHSLTLIKATGLADTAAPVAEMRDVNLVQGGSTADSQIREAKDEQQGPTVGGSG